MVLVVTVYINPILTMLMSICLSLYFNKIKNNEDTTSHFGVLFY